MFFDTFLLCQGSAEVLQSRFPPIRDWISSAVLLKAILLTSNIPRKSFQIKTKTKKFQKNKNKMGQTRGMVEE